MSTFNEHDHPRAADSGEFTTKPQSEPELNLASGRTLSELPVGSNAARAGLAAAAGDHHTFLLHDGSKTADANALVTELARLAGNKPVVRINPSMTAAQLFGSTTRQGLIADAHGGILVIENAAEMQSSFLDALRQPMEIGEMAIGRGGSGGEVTRYPAKFQLVILSKSDPCGNAADCACSPHARRRYLSRLPGPLVDRVSLQAIISDGAGTTDLGDTDARVERAREITADTLAGTVFDSFGEMPGAALRTGKFRLPAEDTAVLDRALERGGITMRGYDRVLRVAWTQAALDGASVPSKEHIDQALQLRRGYVDQSQQLLRG